MKKIVLIGLLGFVLTACLKPEVKWDIADMSVYGTDSKNYYKMTLAESADFLDSGTGILLYGFSTCPWCVDLLPVLTEVIEEEKVMVYYIDVRPEGTDIRNHDEPGYSKIIEKSKDFLSLDDEGNPRLYVPQLFAVKNGKIIAGHADTVEGHDASQREMTPEEILQLKSIIRELLATIK